MIKTSTLRVPNMINRQELLNVIMEDIKSHFHHTKKEYKKIYFKEPFKELSIAITLTKSEGKEVEE